MNIYFRIDGQNIKRVDCKEVASNSKGFLYAVFEFGSEWDSLSRKAVFRHDNSSFLQLLDSDACLVPWEVLNEGEFAVSVIGIGGEGEIRATTCEVNVAVNKGASLDSDNASVPTATEMEQLTAIVTSVREDADNGVFNGKDGELTEEQARKLEQNASDIADLRENKADKDEIPTTADEVGADAKGTATGAVAFHNVDAQAHSNVITAHNTDTNAHNDIRMLIDDKLDTAKLDDAVDAVLAEAKASGEFDGKNAEMYSERLYRVYSAKDLEDLCVSIAGSMAYMINLGETFDIKDTTPMLHTINTGGIYSIIATEGGKLYEASYCEEYSFGSDEDTLFIWHEVSEDGDYSIRYTPMLREAKSEYELIKAITTTAEDEANELAGYTIEVDEKGNSIKLKEFICFCSFPAATAAAALILKINGTSVYKRSSTLNTSASYVRLEAALRGKWVAGCMATTSTGGTAANYMSFLRGVVTEKATNISLSVEGAVFPEGTNIEIYGVRA